MKIQIRQACFETNSSSSHSLTISRSGREDCLPIFAEYYSETEEKSYFNAVVLTGGEFGWGVETHTDAFTKANYIATYFNYFGDEKENEKAMFERVLKAKTGADCVVYDLISYPYIDHQSIDCAEDALKSEEYLAAFIFNRESVLIIDNDNH